MLLWAGPSADLQSPTVTNVVFFFLLLFSFSARVFRFPFHFLSVLEVFGVIVDGPPADFQLLVMAGAVFFFWYLFFP